MILPNSASHSMPKGDCDVTTVITRLHGYDDDSRWGDMSNTLPHGDPPTDERERGIFIAHDKETWHLCPILYAGANSLHLGDIYVMTLVDMHLDLLVGARCQ